MPLGTDDQSTRDAVEARRKANAARPNDGVESASFTPFRPAVDAFQSLNNAEHGYTPDGDLLWSPEAPGQAKALLARAQDGEPGVGVYLRTVQTTDVAVPVVIGTLDDMRAELDACHCLPENRLDYDLAPGGLFALAVGRFAGAKDSRAVTLLMGGCGYIQTAAQISYGKPTVDLGLALPLAKTQRATDDLRKAEAALAPWVPVSAGATDEQLAIKAAHWSLVKAIGNLDNATTEFDFRLHQPARLKPGASHGADTWGPDPSKNGTEMAKTFTLEEAFQLWQSEKAKTAGTPGAGAGGFSETAPSGGSGGRLKG